MYGTSPKPAVSRFSKEIVIAIGEIAADRNLALPGIYLPPAFLSPITSVRAVWAVVDYCDPHGTVVLIAET